MELFYTELVPVNKYIVISNGIEQAILIGKGTSYEKSKEILNKIKAPV